MEEKKSIINCGNLDNIEISYLNFYEIDNLNNNAYGIYCWFYVPDYTNKVAYGFVNDYNPKIEAKGLFRGSYSGQMKRNDLCPPIPNDDYSKYTKILRQSCIAFSTPLYIGMSIRIASRLKDHKNSIEKLFWEYRNSDIDNIQLSSATFAERILENMINYNIELEELYVKYIIIDKESFDKDDIKYIETILNDLNTPMYGER